MRSIIIFCFSFLIITTIFSQSGTRPSVYLPEATNMQVNSYTGSLIYQRDELFIPGRGLNFELTFTYNSQQNRDLGYGHGWTHNYNILIESGENNTKVITWGNGKRDEFTLEDGAYVPPVGVYHTLEEYEPQKFLLTTKYGMKYFFSDYRNRISKIEDRNSNAMLFTYNADGLSSITGPAGRILQINWQSGRMISIVEDFDTPTRTWQYTYNETGNLETVTNPMGYQIHYHYSPFNPNFLVRVIDENQNETYVEYGGDNYAKSVTTCITKHEFSYDFESGAGQSYVKELMGNEYITTTYAYDSLGRNMTRSGNCCGNDNAFAYNDNNNITQSTDANGNMTQYEFDAKGNITKTISPLGCELVMSYGTEFSNLLSLIDKMGNLTTYSYDSNGNLEEVIKPLNIIETFTYDQFGNLSTSINGEGEMTQYDYNVFGYMSKITMPDNSEANYIYDNRGNLISYIDANENSTNYEYDDLNRLTNLIDPLGFAFTYSYDGVGNKIILKNANNQEFKIVYDALNRIIESHLPLEQSNYYKYNAKGNITELQNPKGGKSKYVYNSQGKLVKEIDPLGFETNNVYDLKGNLIEKIDPLGNRTKYFFDSQSRLTKVVDPLGFETSYEFDCGDNITKLTNANGNYVNCRL
jgi:YD repeat-containing protein